MQAPTRPRGRHVRGGAPLPGPEALAELAAEMQAAPPAPGPGSDVALVNPEIFSALERYKQADRGAVKKGLGRLFSTRPGAAAVAPTTPATLEQLQAAGETIRLVSQVADLTAKITALDVEIAGATKSQQDAAGNRARAAVWEKSGVPVDMRPLRSGVLGAEIASNQAAFQEERLQARALAQAQADKVSKDQLTKERAKKAGLARERRGRGGAGLQPAGHARRHRAGDLAEHGPDRPQRRRAGRLQGLGEVGLGLRRARPRPRDQRQRARQRAVDHDRRDAPQDRDDARPRRRVADGDRRGRARHGSRARRHDAGRRRDHGLQGVDRGGQVDRARRSARWAASSSRPRPGRS